MGDAHGMLHAIKTATGEELWSYIPSNLLNKLKNDRADPNAENNFAAVDGSPTAADIYYQAADDLVKKWHTILLCSQGYGGTSIFALDVSNPELDQWELPQWELLWEGTVEQQAGEEAPPPGGGMGHASRVSMGKVK